jgi:hypothetical protein
MRHYSKNRIVIKWLLVFVFIAIKFSSSGQVTNDWTTLEKQFYGDLKALCSYAEAHHGKIDIRDSMVKKYVLFDYVLNDTSKNRVETRVVKVNQLLEQFGHFIDSANMINLDAEPIRFLQNKPAIYQQFEEHLKDQVPYIFAYYNKGNAGKPLGYLLFDLQSKKLVSWILFNQGGHYYFLTFDLI